MTTPSDPRPSPPVIASPSGRPGLSARDAERVAAAVEADSPPPPAPSRLGWHKWEEWCDARGITAMPSHPDALAAYLAERAEG